MPTAAKLVAALCLAVVAYITSEAIKPVMPPETNFGSFTWVNVVIGLGCGWVVTGSRADGGIGRAIGAGLTGVVALVFWGLAVQAVNEMVARSFKRRYDTATEAIASVFEIAADWGVYLGNQSVWMPLVIGAIVTGLLTGIASYRWR